MNMPVERGKIFIKTWSEIEITVRDPFGECANDENGDQGR
jgi:hypothetical protein